MELYLVRHGETESNIKRRYQGWTESPLSEKGLLQAQKAGYFLSRQDVNAVYSSDLKRAVNTARVIGSSRGLQPGITPLLREIHFGEWEGLTFEEIEKSWGNEITHWLDDPFHKAAPGGETLQRVCERMQMFLEEIGGKHKQGDKIVAVSHGGSIRALLYNLLNLDLPSFWEIKIDNASISLIQKENESFKVAYYNRTDHLAAGEAGEDLVDDLKKFKR